MVNLEILMQISATTILSRTCLGIGLNGLPCKCSWRVGNTGIVNKTVADRKGDDALVDPRVGAGMKRAEQIVGRERRERVSQLA
jgi:hypothetical protein